MLEINKNNNELEEFTDKIGNTKIKEERGFGQVKGLFRLSDLSPISKKTNSLKKAKDAFYHRLDFDNRYLILLFISNF